MFRKIKTLAGGVILAVLFAASCSAFANTLFITKLRVIRKPHHWQFVFETNAPIHCNYHYLSNPNRAVLDCPGVHLKHMISDATYVTTPVTMIHARRYKNTLRLTFDLDHAVKVHTFRLPAIRSYHHRYVVDLEGHPIKVVGFGLPNRSKRIAPKKYNLVPTVTPTSLLAKRERKVIVVIDPGHGGKDPGATGGHGTHEKNVVLAISKDLQKDINRIPGFKAVLTRTGDYFIPLRGRLAIARRYKADMFIAIHADAYRNHTAHGVSVFALSRRGATSEAARWLAARENKSELMGGVDLYDKSHMLKSVLINLSQTATIRTSLQIGTDLVRNIGRFAHLHHGYRVEQAAFVVLKSPDIPSLLVETGFISNPQEERRLVSHRYQNRLAQSMANGITEYFESRPPRGTALAQQLHKRHYG
jgi:N-acetylmuramoyl-L-alanine amidase